MQKGWRGIVKYLERLEGNPPGNFLDYPTKDKTHMEFTEDNESNSDTIEPSEYKRNNIVQTFELRTLKFELYYQLKIY